MKKLKMLLYGEPGVGKSTFACKAPNPFFITTDGNYEWLEDFGAKEEAHKQIFSWEEAKKAFAQPYDEYDTIVVDLLEDMFKWCEMEYCARAKLEHVSDVGFGKGYDITRNEFFMEIAKLLAKDKHIILITHGITFTTKDRRGVEHTKYAPSSRIPDKVMDMIEGRVRYCLRCYLKAEEQSDGTLIKKRYLSLIPKENEFGIARGLDENITPHDINLDFAEFAKYIGLDTNAEVKPVKQTIKEEPKAVKEAAKVETKVEPEVEIKEEPKVEIKEETKAQPEQTIVNNVATEKPEVVKEQPVEQPKQMSNEDKIAAIKAKLAAINAKNK